MRKIFLILAVIIMGTMLTGCGQKEVQRDDLKDNKYYVCYNEVNLRAEPDDSSEILGQLTLGQSVDLTGKVVEYFWNEVNPFWFETEDGAWITGNALMEESEFEFRFGY